MDRRKVVIVISAAVAFCAVTAVAATPKKEVNAPLYTFRMEQVSCKMGFLPTTMNKIIYTAEKGYVLDYAAGGGYSRGVRPLDSEIPDTFCTCILLTCEETCVTCNPTCDDPTCPATCSDTCGNTCPAITCWDTCGPPVTCGHPHC